MTGGHHGRLPVFVYGTLRPGRRNHDRFLRGRTVAEVPATLRGAVLYEGPGYPYAVAAPAGEVRGELITVAPEAYDEVLAALDELEGHRPGDPRNLYERVVCEVAVEGGGTVRGWVYVAAERWARRLRAEGRTVPGGDWTG
ncbi:gamma-glutamylcyclotransferase family protein [Streptomyces griseocarneus]|uniref:gamma-glutamylcyclotransferase family protein n=1 Tax=Streptomyces griseocarneus TaxID=51201 RepID=UPI0019C7BADD|nr:gamma-glutamylcyclotransferase family protein [Streptomyces griseocarneus]MBZ6474249.1 gamma-glutamylcyclotransferase [Streptomyces griseocarneus]GHG52863.1 gamma-glutamylcyclotransferase [Streptomyces griseocarneus]